MNVTPESTLGFGHFIAQSDAVGKTLLAVLVLMSVMSWLIIALKGLTLVARRRRSHAFLNFFWNATSLEAVQHEIATHGVKEPFAHLTAHAMHAQAHHARHGATRLADADITYVGEGHIADRQQRPWWRRIIDGLGL